MIFSENRCPSRITSGTCFSGSCSIPYRLRLPGAKFKPLYWLRIFPSGDSTQLSRSKHVCHHRLAIFWGGRPRPRPGRKIQELGPTQTLRARRFADMRSGLKVADTVTADDDDRAAMTAALNRLYGAA